MAINIPNTALKYIKPRSIEAKSQKRQTTCNIKILGENTKVN